MYGVVWGPTACPWFTFVSVQCFHTLEHPAVLGKDSLPKWMLRMTNMAAHRFLKNSFATLASKVAVSCLLWYLLASRRLEGDATRFQTTYCWASSVYPWYTAEPNCVWYRLVTCLPEITHSTLPHSAKNPYDSRSTSHSWAHDWGWLPLSLAGLRQSALIEENWPWTPFALFPWSCLEFGEAVWGDWGPCATPWKGIVHKITEGSVVSRVWWPLCLLAVVPE